MDIEDNIGACCVDPAVWGWGHRAVAVKVTVFWAVAPCSFMSTNVSEESAASVVRLCVRVPWRLSQHVAPKRWYPTKVHGVISRSTVIVEIMWLLLYYSLRARLLSISLLQQSVFLAVCPATADAVAVAVATRSWGHNANSDTFRSL
jgi:hypothetical protein